MRKVIQVVISAVAILVLSLNYASAQNCVILQRGTQPISFWHLQSLGVQGHHYLWVEGTPVPNDFHGTLSDKDVQKLVASGVRVQILDNSFQPTVGKQQREAVEHDFFQERLESARKMCAS